MKIFKVYHLKLKRAALFLVLALLPALVFSFAFNGFSKIGFENYNNFNKKCYADEITDALPSYKSGETDQSYKAEETETASDGEFAEEMRRAIEEFCDQLDLSALDEFYKNYGGAFSSGDLKQTLLKIASGEAAFEYSDAFSLIFALSGTSLKALIPIIITVFCIAVFYGIISSVSNSPRTGSAMFNVCYAAGVGVIFCEMLAVTAQTIGSIKNLCTQADAVFPLLITLLSLSGGNAAVGFFKPVCVFVAGAGMGLALNVLTPVAVSVAAISGISSFSDKFSLKKFSGFLQSAFKWILGAVLTVFSFFTAVGGMSAVGYDGAMMRIFKYTIAGGIPFVGGFAKDSVDVVLTGATLIKNSIGGVVTVCMFFSMLSSVIKIACFSLCLKLTAAFCEPVSDGRFGEAISAFSKSLSMLAAVVVYVFIIYFVAMAVLIGAQSAVFA